MSVLVPLVEVKGLWPLILFCFFFFATRQLQIVHLEVCGDQGVYTRSVNKIVHML